MKLHSSIPNLSIPHKMILRVSEDANLPRKRGSEVLISDIAQGEEIEGFPLVLSRSRSQTAHDVKQLPSELDYVAAGDVLRFDPSGHVTVLYRKNSRFNSMLVTE